MRNGLAISVAVLVVACGGSTHHQQVQEVPIDQGGGGHSDDDPGSGSSSATIVPASDASAPPGVGPQSLDTPADAGSSTTNTAPAFVAHAGGLTQKECSDVIMVLAKEMTKENHVPTPTAADLAQHPIFGQMLAECGNNTTKKQHKCAMASKTTAAWKKCME